MPITDGETIGSQTPITANQVDSSVDFFPIIDQSESGKAKNKTITCDELRKVMLKQVAGVVSSGSSSLLISSTHGGQIIEMTSSGANSVICPSDSGENLPIGFRVEVTQMGTGLTSIDFDNGVTLLGPVNCRGQYQGLTLYKRAANVWVIIGGE